MLNRLRLWLRTVLFRGRLDREMREELDAHIASRTQELIAQGLHLNDAYPRARREFGALGPIHEEARDARGARGIESIWADCRFAFRHFRRTPIAAITMIAIFALGIGFSTVVFVTLHSFTSSRLPGLAADDSMVRIRGIDRSRGEARTIGREFPYLEYADYAARTDLFGRVGAWSSFDAVFEAGDRAVRGESFSGAVTYVSDGYFPVLGVQLVQGTGLPSSFDDFGDPHLAAVISDVVWERMFNRSADVVGKTLMVNKVLVTVVGVAPARFNGVRTGGSRMRIWLPLNARDTVQHAFGARNDGRPEARFGLVARLAPEITLPSIQAAVEVIAARTSARLNPAPAQGRYTADVVPVLADNYFPPSGEGPDAVARATSLLIPLIVLLITCTNVSALQAGLAAVRRREIAVRLSMGASRGRVIRQLVTESVVLALVAGALAVFVIWAALRLFESGITDLEVIIDARTMLFTTGLAATAGIVFGLSPALHATRVSVSDALKTAGGTAVTSSRLQAWLVVAQIAFTQPALLAMGSLVLEMSAEIREVPSSVVADRVLEVRYNTNERYGELNAAREKSLARVRTGLEKIPDVVAVVPQGALDEYLEVTLPPEELAGTAIDTGRADVQVVSAPPGYFQLMNVPLTGGRDFTSGDLSSKTDVIVSQALARRLWGSASPVGRQLVRTGGSQLVAMQMTVVGVVDEAAAGRSDLGREPRMFVPAVDVTGHFLLRTRVPAESVIPAVRAAALTEAPEVPVVSVRTLAASEAARRGELWRVMGLAAGSASLALVLTAIGLYAVVAFNVSQRSREIGIRTALGATRPQVVRLFTLRGLRFGLAGLVVGLTLSFIFVRLMSLARGDEPMFELLVLAAAAVVGVVAVATVASWIPARRAARIDPLETLRME